MLPLTEVHSQSSYWCSGQGSYPQKIWHLHIYTTISQLIAAHRYHLNVSRKTPSICIPTSVTLPICNYTIRVKGKAQESGASWSGFAQLQHKAVPLVGLQCKPLTTRFSFYYFFGNVHLQAKSRYSERLWTIWFPRLCISGRCRNLETMVMIVAPSGYD